MRPLLLYGNYELTIDDKNRMLVPSEIRKQLVADRDGEAFFLVLGIDGRPWFYPERHYEALISRDPSQLTPAEEALSYDRMNLGLASRVEPDNQGRVLIPDKTLKRAGISKDVTLVGVRDHLELWDRAEWNAEQDALDARRAEIAAKAKEARQAPK